MDRRTRQDQGDEGDERGEGTVPTQPLSQRREWHPPPREGLIPEEAEGGEREETLNEPSERKKPHGQR